jgi:hypothetical protein
VEFLADSSKSWYGKIKYNERKMMDTILERDATSDVARELACMITAMFMAHDQAAKDSKKRVRKIDGLPYGVHPGLAAFMMLAEQSFPVPQRLRYSKALNYHDTGEDTNAAALIEREVRELVAGLTFDDDVDSSVEAIKRGPEIAMLKSYDSFCNLLGLEKMVAWPREKKLNRIAKSEKVFTFARQHYPGLFLWILADALVAHLKKIV